VLELFIITLLIGFLVYYFIRHPLRSMKRIGQVVGLLVLGVTAMGVFLVFSFGMLTLLNG
jgi:hypothetical protein